MSANCAQGRQGRTQRITTEGWKPVPSRNNTYRYYSDFANIILTYMYVILVFSINSTNMYEMRCQR